MIESFLRYLEHERRYSPHTLKSYQNDLTQFRQFIKGIDASTELHQVIYPHIRAWIVELVEDKISARSINRKMASLKAFYKFLLVREMCITNPTQKLKSLKTEKKLPQFVGESEMVKLLDQIPFPEGFIGRRDKMIFEMLYGTGIRLSELINLEIDDVNFYDSTIKVLGKRNKERIIPIPDSVIIKVREYIDIRKEHFSNNVCKLLVVTDKCEKSYPMMIDRIVNLYLNLVTTSDKKSPHVLRHTFATHLLNKGANLNAVKELLGHANLAATQVYTHNSIEKLKRTFDQAHPKA